MENAQGDNWHVLRFAELKIEESHSHSVSFSVSVANEGSPLHEDKEQEVNIVC
jgi:hypothetical protein